MKKLFFATILLISASCTKDYHFNRFIKKGGQINPTIEWKTVTKTDTIPGKDGNDSIVYRIDSTALAKFETDYIPKWKIKQENKRFADSLDFVRRLELSRMKHALKIEKQLSKRLGDSLDFVKEMYQLKIDSIIKVGKNEAKIAKTNSKTEIKTTKTKEKAGNRWSLVGLLFALALVVIVIGVVFRRR